MDELGREVECGVELRAQAMPGAREQLEATVGQARGRGLELGGGGERVAVAADHEDGAPDLLEVRRPLGGAAAQREAEEEQAREAGLGGGQAGGAATEAVSADDGVAVLEKAGRRALGAAARQRDGDGIDAAGAQPSDVSRERGRRPEGARPEDDPQAVTSAGRGSACARRAARGRSRTAARRSAEAA